MAMDGDHPAPVTAGGGPVGFLLLPSELLHEILLRLALPDLHRLRPVCRDLAAVVADDGFRQQYHLRSSTGGAGAWLFVFKKRPPRDAVLRGFHDRSGRWFRLPAAPILSAAAPPGEDLFFLAASGRFFLFASNGRRELLVVDLASSSARRLPPCPLGPRGTSSWRRSGLKLVADPPDSGGRQSFRFLFAEIQNDRPFLFEYRSDCDTWQSYEAWPTTAGPYIGLGPATFLCARQARPDCVLVHNHPGSASPVIFRPRFPHDPHPLSEERLHVYGDGYAALIKSTVTDDGGPVRVRIFTQVKLFGLGPDGSNWVMVSSVPAEIIEKIKKPYGAMMGLLAERDGVIMVVLMSNCRGSWYLVWLAYESARVAWRWIPVPDCGSRGLNSAGIAISATFSRLWPSSSSSKA